MEAVCEAEILIRRVLEELGGPGVGGVTCTPAFLLERSKTVLDTIDTATTAFSLYNNDPSGELKAISMIVKLSWSLIPHPMVQKYVSNSASLVTLLIY